MLGDKLLRTIVSLWADNGPFRQTCLMNDIAVEAFVYNVWRLLEAICKVFFPTVVHTNISLDPIQIKIC